MLKTPNKFTQIAEIAKQSGFAYAMKKHFAVFLKRSDTRLIVTFDNMKSRDLAGPRMPWGYDFVKSQGASHLSLMMSGKNDWFRHAQVVEMFDTLKAEGFFAQFSDVVFYGSSMGGYGALAFCSAAPGARVIASTPQTSLDETLVPWENRYDMARARGDWTGAYADAAIEARTASKVTVLYDPYFEPDQRHVARLDPTNLVALRCPWMDHKILPRLNYMGLMKPAINGAISGDLDADGFNRMFRQHRANKSRTRTVLQTALARGHKQRVARALKSLNSSNPDWNFRRLRIEARA